MVRINSKFMGGEGGREKNWKVRPVHKFEKKLKKKKKRTRWLFSFQVSRISKIFVAAVVSTFLINKEKNC